MFKKLKKSLEIVEILFWLIILIIYIIISTWFYRKMYGDWRDY